jgi:ferritin-like metal-binding protein YciE
MHQKLYLRWLNDAHAMEEAIEQILAQQIEATEKESVRTKLQEHLDATRRHAQLMEERIEAQGEDASAFKVGSAKAFGFLDGMMMKMPEDRAIKNAIGSYAIEAFEIASYAALIAAAQEMDDQETARACEIIMRDEEEMSLWLEEQLPVATKEVMMKAAKEHERQRA